MSKFVNEKIGTRILIGMFSLLILFPACQQDEHIRVTLDQRLSKFKPRWAPNFLRDFYPEDEEYPTIWGGDVKLGDFSCRIGLYDQNQNNQFNDIGKDILLLAPYGEDEVTLFPHATAEYLKKDFVLNVRGTYWEVMDLDTFGQWIDLRELKDSLTPPDIQFIDVLPNIPLETLAGDTTYFHDHLEKGKLLYVEVWSSWHQYSFESTPTLKKTYHAYKDQLNVFTLIYNEVDYDRVHRNNKVHGVDWPQAIYSMEAGAALLHLGWVPYGVLFSADGSMIKSGLRPQELDDFLEDFL